MPYIPSQKIISAARQIAEDIGIRGLTVVQSFDSSGNPVLSIGTVTAGSQGATVRLQMAPTIMTDGLGNTQRVFSPAQIQLICEQLAGNSGTLVLTAINYSTIFFELAKHGMTLSVYETTNTTAPTVANIPSAPVATYQNLWAPLISTS